MRWEQTIDDFRHRLGLEPQAEHGFVFSAVIDGIGHLNMEKVNTESLDYSHVVMLVFRQYPEVELESLAQRAFQLCAVNQELEGSLPSVVSYKNQYLGFCLKLEMSDFDVRTLEKKLIFLGKLLDKLEQA